ncbi:hypothetical protein [Natronobacterium gregoryi]|uniref:Uncharacterized protein n=2 Tax=Natronobacterium gregoryi TaxID=44930 RepID=L0ALM7_NATGS|nr:hypothetical protein [Natronobacterium gregoryi]AFZ74798.1 hypothetical protein Natgr_3691 [Natronobacterium gregoryi SP2]ELY66129.1 hypothetical protein C490_13234 [Natronobacterium gregoryi SP2]PLK19496.1 hypothetical protein CYV19_14660 [Natronobacterium gregoryi SP2]SFJ43343.1 hypothetical protein SAMN05443661_12915 [Natronobacterium gregoryi]
METRWATIDGVRVHVPEDITADELRDRLHKPDDAVLIAVTGDLVAVVHEDDRPLSELIAGCANTYYFRRDGDVERTDIPAIDEIETAVTDPSQDETTFQRPDVDR